MASTIGLISYNDTSRQEDVVDIVVNVDYTSTPFLSRIGESVATNTFHEWQIDTLAAPAYNAGVEGADVTTTDPQAPTRRNNVVQLFQKNIVVSDTEIAIPHYGLNDPFEYQTQKKMKEVARDMELAWIAGTRASGSSGVARAADGAIALITTNKTARNSGSSLPESEFTNLLKMVYDAGTDETVDLILTSSYLKVNAIDNYATNTTRYLDAEAFRQAHRVDIYQSSFGQHEVVLERNIPAGGLLGIDSSKWRTAWLVNRRMAVKPLAKTGSATKALMEGEATVEALNEKSSFYASGYFFG